MQPGSMALESSTLVLVLLATANSPPIQARRIDAQRVHRLMLRTALTADKLGRHTLNEAAKEGPLGCVD